MPWHAEGITLDIDRSLKNMAAAYCQSGSLERWIQIMTPHRSRDKFRFILAASFAAPLLRIIKQRIFFVYNWGGSKGGKTAALEAALSAWGNPERLMVNFNATNVGLERAAAFNCDLPLGIDERQLAGTNQAAVEQKIYMIASGKGRTRGDKTGGIQATQEWRTIALSTGEEPLSTETTQTGVSTRTLEIYGGPFDNETEAGEMYQQVAENHGWAGPAYIERLLELQESWIVETYQRMRDYVRGISEGKNGAHIAGIAAVALADAFIDSWFFGGKWEDSWTAAQDMARSILINQVESNATDVNENALQFITDWVLANKEQFKANAIGTCYGFFSDTGNTVYIYPSLLNQALKKEGFPARKTMKYLADRELVGMEIDPKTKKKVYSVRRWFSNRTTRFVEFRIGEIAEQRDAIDDADELRRQPESWNAAPTPGGFTDVTEEEDQYELPF